MIVIAIMNYIKEKSVINTLTENVLKLLHVIILKGLKMIVLNILSIILNV